MTEPTPTPEALALATAARLAHALDPDGWARCRGDCILTRYHPEPRTHYNGRYAFVDEDCDVECTTLAAAQAEWAAAGGDPELGPAPSGTTADGRVRWRSNEFGVSVHVGFLVATRRAGSMGWDFGGHGTSACLVELGRLAEAADGGAR